ncbi:MAG: hypothetical protein R6U62_08415 [Bacteroidales bacterium]
MKGKWGLGAVWFILFGLLDQEDGIWFGLACPGGWNLVWFVPPGGWNLVWFGLSRRMESGLVWLVQEDGISCRRIPSPRGVSILRQEMETSCLD